MSETEIMTIQGVASLTAAEREILAEVKEAIRRYVPVADVYLYGSVARGTHQPDSDYDILVLARDSVEDDVQESVCDALYEVELAHSVVLSTIFHTWSEWEHSALAGSPFRRNVQQDAIRL